MDKSLKRETTTDVEADAIRPLDTKLQRVLDGNYPLVIGEKFDEGIEQRGLARSGFA